MIELALLLRQLAIKQVPAKIIQCEQCGQQYEFYAPNTKLTVTTMSPVFCSVCAKDPITWGTTQAGTYWVLIPI